MKGIDIIMIDKYLIGTKKKDVLLIILRKSLYIMKI